MSAAVVREFQELAVLGIRHHGPGSARSLVRALADFAPDAVLIEGPADADPVLGLARGLEPPVALLAYAADEPKVASFWPFAVFSPEWQALIWALERDVAVSMCDLPAATVLAGPLRWGARRPRLREDPLASLAAAAGYDDPERWWEDVVEGRADGSSPFPEIADAMAELRPARADPDADPGEARREAYMRRTIRGAWRAGHRRVAVVCGAWHAPAVRMPLGPAAGDAAILRGLPRRKVTLTWVPWTHARLAVASGYGAGITSPGWYHHLWTAPDRPIVRWMTAVAGSLRAKDLAVSSAHVIEGVRLAETLAALRGRPLAGLIEVTDATRAVLCGGDEAAVRYVTEDLVVGQALGAVGDDVPTVPLEADLLAQCRRLRVRREPTTRLWELDLRRPIDRDRSVLFHRLALLAIGWIRPTADRVAGRGTFRETWRSHWRPELAIDIVLAAMWGTTLESAADARVEEVCGTGGLAELAGLLGDCLRAELSGSLARLLAALDERAARDDDVEHLMTALPELARASRYGDVRRTAGGLLAPVVASFVIRICAGLGPAAMSLDDDAAQALRTRIDAVHGALAVFEADEGERPLSERWLAALAQLAEREDLNDRLAGRVTRLLLDAGRLADAPVRMRHALSRGRTSAARAGWIDGFFADGATLLVHDPALRGLLEDWVAGLDPEEFTQVLPLVRRTFATFRPAERRAIAERIARADAPDQDGGAADPELYAMARETVRRILGEWP